MDLYPGEVLPDKAAGVVHIAADHLAQLVHPLGALRGVGADEGVHGEDVHGVVVGEGALLFNALPQGLVVDDVDSCR